MRKYGFNFSGIEEAYEYRIKQAHEERTTKNFRYVEVGIAQGTTLRSVAELCREICMCDFQCVGVDLVNGAYFDAKAFLMRTLAFDTHIEFESGRRDVFVADCIRAQIRVLLLKSDTKRIQGNNGCVNFCLIDGCHGAPCVRADFLAVEPMMAKGGIVAFHDAGEEEQGQCFQPHCGTGIGVQEALGELGLRRSDGTSTVYKLGLSEGDLLRLGWKFLGFTPGDRVTDKNPEAIGHGIVFFQKL